MFRCFLVDVNTLAYGLRMNDKHRLDKEAWIQAGFRALTARGPTALKAEPLARELGVSKGSFYWHFANLGAFREAMIDYWMAMATQGVMHAVQQSSVDPAERLATLVILASEPPPAAVGGPAAEGAIRCWGRADATVGERLRAVDAARVDYCAELFQAAGFADDKAQLKARLLYAGLIGLEQLDLAALANLRADLQALLQLLLSR